MELALITQKIANILLKANPGYETAEEAWRNVFEVTAYHVGSLPDHLPIELEVGLQLIMRDFC